MSCQGFSETQNEASRALIEAGVSWRVARSVARRLAETGWLVDREFHVPSDRGLATMYSQLRYVRMRPESLRWVMCKEIHDALWQRYNNLRYAKPANPFDPESPLIPTYETSTVMDRPKWSEPARLFGIPIRIDPAARHVMFELVDEKAEAKQVNYDNTQTKTPAKQPRVGRVTISVDLGVGDLLISEAVDISERGLAGYTVGRLAERAVARLQAGGNT